MFSKKQKIIISLCALVVLVTIFSFLSLLNYPEKISIRGQVFSVEVADTEYLQRKGLSGQKPLQDREGMLFIFNYPGNYGIWMKDMLFPIDIIWLNSERAVVHVEKSVSPDTYPTVFYPNTDSLYVLEIKSGVSNDIGIQIGDRIEFISKNF